MNMRQVRLFFQDKKDTPCPLTERLIKAGYQQTGGGYIALAKKRGITVDYKKAEPTQYWHLFEEYLPTVDENKTFSKSIVCGELIFWMAEVSEAVPKEELGALVDEITNSSPIPGDPPKYDRIKWNTAIQELCFDAIAKAVGTHS